MLIKFTIYVHNCSIAYFTIKMFLHTVISYNNVNENKKKKKNMIPIPNVLLLNYCAVVTGCHTCSYIVHWLHVAPCY